MKENKLLYVIEQFISLNETERELFLKVVNSEHENSSKSLLPPEFTEESFYKKLTETHNERVRKRLKKLNKDQEKPKQHLNKEQLTLKKTLDYKSNA